jgi:hypothetical protein
MCSQSGPAHTHGRSLCQTQFAVTTALAIYGFDAAGALGTGLAGARLVPAAPAGVLAGKVAARGSPGFVLLGVVVVELLALCALSGALFAGAPFGIVLGLATVDALVATAYRPAQARVLPTLVRTPSELTAAAGRLTTSRRSASWAAPSWAHWELTRRAPPGRFLVRRSCSRSPRVAPFSL